jgi:hypothetical protein
MGEAGIDAVCMDGITFLFTGLVDSSQSEWPEWIVPAIPVHVAWLWIKERLEADFDVLPVDLPEAVLEFLPHGMKGKAGAVYASLADFICPEECPEPVDRCTITQKPRPYNLYDRIRGITHPGITPIVIQSFRLAPGVGGYSPGALFESLSLIHNTRNVVMLSTACRCHGVLHTFKIERKGGSCAS